MSDQTCTIEDCSRTGRLNGKWCRMHYQRWKKHGDPLVTRKPGRKPKPDAQRFWPKVDKVDGGCWLWTASMGAGGYGRFDANGHQIAAHRWAYQALVGPISEGLHLDHLCRVRNCVNPEHLEPVTHAENLRRGAMAKHLESTGRVWNGPAAGIPDAAKH